MNFCTKLIELQHIQFNWEITQSQEAEMEVKRYILSSPISQEGERQFSKDKIPWKFVL